MQFTFSEVVVKIGASNPSSFSLTATKANSEETFLNVDSGLGVTLFGLLGSNSLDGDPLFTGGIRVFDSGSGTRKRFWKILSSAPSWARDLLRGILIFHTKNHSARSSLMVLRHLAARLRDGFELLCRNTAGRNDGSAVVGNLGENQVTDSNDRPMACYNWWCA